MAASTYYLQFNNGTSLSVYQAANQAVNSSPVCTSMGAAASTTTTTDFSVPTMCHLEDVKVSSALTAGGIELYNVTLSKRTGLQIPNLESYLDTNTTRKPPKIGFRPGYTYRWIQIIAGNA